MAAARIDRIEAQPEATARLMPWRRAEKHADRAAAQAAEKAVYLVAWNGEEPVGHVFVKWPGALSSKRAAMEACVEIEDLYVRSDKREQGVGDALLAAAEEEAQARGFDRIGLAVGLENEPALRLYGRRGYADAGHGVFTLTWTSRDEAGRERQVREDCRYLVKSLA